MDPSRLVPRSPTPYLLALAALGGIGIVSQNPPVTNLPEPPAIYWVWERTRDDIDAYNKLLQSTEGYTGLGDTRAKLIEKLSGLYRQSDSLEATEPFQAYSSAVDEQKSRRNVVIPISLAFLCTGAGLFGFYESNNAKQEGVEGSEQQNWSDTDEKHH